MEELKKKSESRGVAFTSKNVTLYFHSGFYVLTGKWDWDLNCNAVFCSDVILSLPAEFEGARAILHPDDHDLLEEILSDNKGGVNHLEFRIITTYGEVRTLSGEDISIEEKRKEEEEINSAVLHGTVKEINWQRQFENLQLIREVYERSERFTGSGIWYHNSGTNDTWYSPQIFQIYGLPPQSLNQHLNTFTAFIHSEDKNQVREFMDKAYRKRTPLHIEYRIETPAGERTVLHISHWFFNSRGEEVLSGSLQDISQQKKMEQRVEESEKTVSFHKQQLLADEQHASLGHWQVNLVTRKSFYSDHLYRIFGLKPQSIRAGVQFLINYIHPDDREAMRTAAKKMFHERQPPELEYRIIRADGKLRYISQTARVLVYGNEMIMSGTIMDVTQQKTLEKKLGDLTEAELVRGFAQRQIEETAGIGTWMWNFTTGEATWNDTMYQLLGYKPNTVELTFKSFLLFIHPDDQNKFSTELSAVTKEKREASFLFRLICRGEVRHMKASIRIMNRGETDSVIGMIQDLTKEFMLGQQLHERVQLAEMLAENILDRVIITDISNNVLVWNPQCEKIYGIRKEDAIGSNFFDVFPHLKTESERHLFNRVLKGEAIIAEGNHSTATGTYFDLHMLPLWNEEHTEVTGILHMIHDVTKETELRQSLRDRLNFIENLVDSSVDRIIAMDRNLNYLVWNKKCEEYYGLKKEQVVGRNVLEIFPETQNIPAYEEFKKVLKGETVHLPVAGEAGKENAQEIYLIPVKNEQGEVSAILWILHELSEN